MNVPSVFVKLPAIVSGAVADDVNLALALSMMKFPLMSKVGLLVEAVTLPVIVKSEEVVIVWEVEVARV